MDGVSDMDPVDIEPVIIPLGESSSDSDQEQEEEEGNDDGDLEGETGPSDQAGNDPEKVLEMDANTAEELPMEQEEEEEKPKSEFKCNFCTETFKALF